MNTTRRAGLLAAILLTTAGTAGAQTASQATASTPAPAASAKASSGNSSDPAKAIQSAMTGGLDKFFASVDATPDQKTQIQGIMIVAVGKIIQLKGQFGKPQDDLYALVSAPTLDRSGFEALRAREMSGVDQVSRIITDAFVDSLAVLTPEQRAKFALKLKPKVHTSTQTPGTAETPPH
jgi:Spy/CpxP family protein refolding chaperone